MHAYVRGGTLPAALATLAVLHNRRAGNDCRSCRYHDPALLEQTTPRPGICGWVQQVIACARWEIGP